MAPADGDLVDVPGNSSNTHCRMDEVLLFLLFHMCTSPPLCTPSLPGHLFPPWRLLPCGTFPFLYLAIVDAARTTKRE